MTEAEVQSAFDDHKDAVYRFAWRMSDAAAAEDIAQEVFLALLSRPERFDPARGTLRAFLLGITRNLALKRWRDAHRWEPLEEEAFVTPPDDLERRDTADAVAACVRALPPLQREVVILAEYEELPLAEIASAVGADVGVVKSRLHRARQNLKRMLQPLRARAGAAFQTTDGQ
jgi:RNA polymerase sigma-70 factor (ECF subfamily)